jgi:Haem-degrading
MSPHHTCVAGSVHHEEGARHASDRRCFVARRRGRWHARHRHRASWRIGAGRYAGSRGETLTDEEMQGIIDAAVAAAEQTTSGLRVDAQGNPVTTRMHIVIVDRNGHLLALHSMEDAWPVSIDIALAKA